MAQGHIIALAGAPILDSEGLRVIAYWARDLRGPIFATSYSWHSAAKLPRPAKDWDSLYGPVTTAAMNNTVELCFAKGPIQVWRMANPVKPEDMEDVFRDHLFRAAEGADPNDVRKTYNAACALLNATRLPLSDHTRAELKAVALNANGLLEAGRTW